jgi:TetR/AcrR family transcriptional regulator
MTSHPATHQARSGSGTIARILTAAEALFAEHGFDAVSMSAIAEAAAVSKANVFHHFNSKHALYQAVLRQACDKTTQQLKHMVAESGAMAVNLGQFAENHLENILEHDRFARLILREILSDMPQEQLKIAQQVFGENFSELVKIIHHGQEQCELRADLDPAVVATLLVGANVFFFQARNVFRHFPEVNFADDPAQYTRMMVDILLRGILAADSGKKYKAVVKSGESSTAQQKE